MKTSKFTDEQIAFALRQAETGTKVTEVRLNWAFLTKENTQLSSLKTPPLRDF